MSQLSDTTSRPSWACILHRPPKRVGAWTRAHDGYRTCDACLDYLREILTDIRRQWLELDPTPGASGEHGTRGAPGFSSRPPASLHVITMRDWASKSSPVAVDDIQYLWDPEADNGYPPLEPGVHGPERAPGAYTQKREVWRGADGRAHTEADQPTRSIAKTLSGICDQVADERGMTPPTGRDPHALIRWLDGQLDWLTRQDWVADTADQIRDLWRDLKPVTGDPGRKRIGTCPNTVTWFDDHTRACEAPLFAPLKASDPTIRCEVCGREWEYTEWRRLGDLLAS